MSSDVKKQEPNIYEKIVNDVKDVAWNALVVGPQGKESADLSAHAIDSYAKGEIGQGVKLGLEANVKAYEHIGEEIKSNIGPMLGGAVGWEIQNLVSGGNDTSTPSSSLITLSSGGPKVNRVSK